MRLFTALLTILVLPCLRAETPQPPKEETTRPPKETTRPPNVLFIALDDLNDWIEPMGGHPQAKTPNLSRLAASGILFDNAHCPAPACNPCRTAILSGRSPHTSGMYDNRQVMREVLPDATLLPRYFSDHGYWSAGSGKILHYIIDPPSWDDYYPEKDKDDPFPPHIPWGKRPKTLPRGGPWQYEETDWYAFDVSDDEFGGDAKVADWISGQLKREHDKPFFLACGIYRPHEPWYVPRKYFDLFPLEDIQLPPGYKEDDLDDLPEEGRKRGPNRYFAHIREQGQWKQGVQAYLASIAYADAMLGRVLDALDASPYRDNTIVVLWSDHGWHLGEKQHWQKFTLWRAATRVPLMVRVPKRVPGLPEGTAAGQVCHRPVNLLSLYPTLTELTGLPAKADNDAPSLVPLLRNPQAEWPHVSLTHLHEPGSFSVSAEEWRYIRYAKGGEELYDIKGDPYEWNNLAGDAKQADKLAEMRALAPRTFSPYVAPQDTSLDPLDWHPAAKGPTPASKTFDIRVEVVFFNQKKVPVKLYRVDAEGKAHFESDIAGSQRLRVKTRSGEVWEVRDLKDKPLGYFTVQDRVARGMIPE